MKYKEAKRLIIEEWDRWIQTQSVEHEEPTGRESLKFFIELQDKRSPLLNFQSRGRDKWQIIHGWLLERKRISDVHESCRLP